MFSENLKKYRKELGLTREEVAFRIREVYGENCTGASIQSWERGTNPKTNMISMLADVLDVPEQYFFDDSDNAIDMIIRDKIPMVNTMVDSVMRIDLISGYVGAGSAGHLLNMDDINEVLHVDKMMVDKRYRDSAVKSLLVIGDSMVPYVDTGDIVMFSVTLLGTCEYVDGKYVIETAQGVMVKNLSFKCNCDIVISSCNKAYDSEIIKAGESQEYLEILGIVVGRVLKG